MANWTLAQQFLLGIFARLLFDILLSFENRCLNAANNSWFDTLLLNEAKIKKRSQPRRVSTVTHTLLSIDYR
jgi:hypothetical protein